MLASPVYWLLRLVRPPLFSFRIRGGAVRVSKGPAPPGLLNDVEAVARDFEIEDGYVDAVSDFGRVSVRFSPGVPAASHQRFRNVVGARRVRA